MKAVYFDTKNKPSASITIGIFNGLAIEIASLKYLNASSDLPRPGPITSESNLEIQLLISVS